MSSIHDPNKAYRNNIWKLYVIKILQWFFLFMPVIYLYYEENGMGMVDLLQVQAVYSVSVALLEVPTGMLGDIIGRKKSLVLGLLFSSVGFSLFYLTGSKGWFMMASILYGAGGSFISGSDTALLYESLKYIGEEDRYLKIEGRAVSFGNFAEAMAAFLGGSIAIVLGIGATFGIQALLFFLGVIIALMVKEVPFERVEKQKNLVNDYMKAIRGELSQNVPMRRILMLSSVLGINTLLFAWIAQPYFKEMLGLEVPEQFEWKNIVNGNWQDNGILWVCLWMALNAWVGIVSMNVHRMVKLAGIRRLAIITVIVLIVPYFILMNTSYWPLFWFFVFYWGRGVVTPLYREQMNRHTPSSIRATMMSIRSLVFRIGFACLSMLVAWSSEAYSFSIALLVCGSIMLVVTLPLLFKFLAVNK